MVSVIVPMRNEERHITECVSSLLDQTYPSEEYEIVIVDGNSSDRSSQLVLQMSHRQRPIRMLSNPAIIVPISLNLGIRNARGDIVIRADAHTVYPTNYVQDCVRYLRETGADNVGGPVITTPANSTLSARMAAAVLSNRFGVGNSHFRTGADEGYVDTVPFGTFRRQLFDRIGFFNESLARNQDNEMNARIRRAGGKIFQTPALTTRYFAPETFSMLIAQTYRNCRWHLFTMQQTFFAMSVRHLVPACFVSALIASIALTPIWSSARLALGLILGIYLAAAAYFSFGGSRGLELRLKVRLPFAFFIFHLSYGLGTLAGLPLLFRRRECESKAAMA